MVLEGFLISALPPILVGGTSLAAEKIQNLLKEKKYSEEVSTLATIFNEEFKKFLEEAKEKEKEETSKLLKKTIEDWEEIAKEINNIDGIIKSADEAVTFFVESIIKKEKFNLSKTKREKFRNIIENVYKDSLDALAKEISGTKLSDELIIQFNITAMRKLNKVMEKIMNQYTKSGPQRRDKDTLKIVRGSDIYSLASNMVQKSERRLYFIERSSSICLGPRPYDKDEKSLHHEVDFIAHVRNWINAASEDRGKRGVYAYNPRETREKMISYGLENKVKENLVKFNRYSEGSSFYITSIKGGFIPMLISDDSVLFSLQREAFGNAIMFYFDKRDFATEMTFMIDDGIGQEEKEKDISILLEEMGMNETTSG